MGFEYRKFPLITISGFLVILLFIGLAGVLLSPTIKWYFFTPEDRQILANGSKEQIREYAKKQAASELEELKDLVVAKMKDIGFEILGSASREQWVAITGRFKVQG